MLTARQYDSDDEGNDPVGRLGVAYRLCDRASGRDPVIAQSHGTTAGQAVQPVLAAGPWVMLTWNSYTYQDCYDVTIAVFRAGHDQPTRAGRVVPCPAELPEAVITPAGAPAALLRLPEAPELERIVAVAKDDRLVELDAAPPDVLSGLRADGEVLRWMHGGEQRAAPAP